MSSASSITVAVRVRPFTVKESGNLAQTPEGQTFSGDGALAASSLPKLQPKGIRKIVQVLDEHVLVFDPPDSNPLTKFQRTLHNPGKRIKDMRYAFDRVFDETATQEEVYANTTMQLLDGVIDGYNATVFAYGATGCGKTHTISGTPEKPGIIFSTMRDLFDKIKAVQDIKHVEISLSYLEIYNETIRDLLIPNGAGKTLQLREDADKRISVPGLSMHTPTDVHEVMDMILTGNANRTISPTEANAVSSRSHAVLQVNVMQKPRTAGLSEEFTMATLSIIDLAGSERASVTKNRGDRLLEGANINRSLLALGNCINALCDPHRRCHVPYRDSKLTRLLKFSLGGNCKTVMIVCVSPSSQHYDETHNTLKYGNRAKNIKTKVTRNMINVDRHVSQYVKAIYDLRQEVEELKSKLAEKTVASSDKSEKARKLQEDQVEEAIRLFKSTMSTQRGFLQARMADIAEYHEVGAKLNMYNAWMRSYDEITAPLPDLLVTQRSVAMSMMRELEIKRNTLRNRTEVSTYDGAHDTAVSSYVKQLESKGVAPDLLKKFQTEAQASKQAAEIEVLQAEIGALDRVHSRQEQLLQTAASATLHCLVGLKQVASEDISHPSLDVMHKLCIDTVGNAISGAVVSKPPPEFGSPMKRAPAVAASPATFGTPLKPPQPMFPHLKQASYLLPTSLSSPMRSPRTFKNSPRKSVGVVMPPRKVKPSPGKAKRVRFQKEDEDGYETVEEENAPYETTLDFSVPEPTAPAPVASAAPAAAPTSAGKPARNSRMAPLGSDSNFGPYSEDHSYTVSTLTSDTATIRRASVARQVHEDTSMSSDPMNEPSGPRFMMPTTAAARRRLSPSTKHNVEATVGARRVMSESKGLGGAMRARRVAESPRQNRRLTVTGGLGSSMRVSNPAAVAQHIQEEVDLPRPGSGSSRMSGGGAKPGWR
ncbi:hypothetical protein G7K_4339-t1 [Saitoella complicata NRRL Y-17804]|uniref:Kinesin-like protein n=3 Tax=Saitoella complicata (strain BCRC 22490 / CBS 7301 / JCM 7358 / NBRC 10748 / NRRL Y-17804) TaxID=698492 RepID=A0A0E9NLB4_SAICN|nr:hypothetical protein G7K_4339-t1 [Saitoella complicata NRRL Y-17804]